MRNRSGSGRWQRPGRRGAGGSLLVVLLFGWLGCGEPAALVECLPKNGMTPVCRFHAPEDLAVVGRWLIVSQMPSTKGPGSLVAFDPSTGTIQPLYPPAGDSLGTLPSAASDAAAVPASGDELGDGGCTAGSPPPVSDFAPHGIDFQDARLFVVNHGRREAIEAFDVGADATGLTLEWKSCTALPADVSANDVVALADGGFAATKMVERPQWKGIAKLLLGMQTGALLRHSPATHVWETVPNSEGRAPNGVEVGRDGAFYIAEWAGHRIVRLTPDGSQRDTVDLDFSPDNLAWSADGRLLVAGQRASAIEVPGCAAIEDGACALPSAVVAIDPTSLKVYPIVDDDPATVLGAASIAVELKGNLWIGSFAGNRLVKREGVR